MDETAILFDRISVSAGVRGTQIIVNPEALQRAAEAVLVDISKTD
jgi:Cys-tRNA(Pro)/Cys-tRNA(Cys) deacylase